MPLIWQSFLIVGLAVIIGFKYYWFATSNVSSGSDDDDSQCFRAAVLEHTPLGNKRQHSYEQIINMNKKVYLEAIRVGAKEGIQLLVLPEDSLINSEDYNRSTLIENILEEMPVKPGVRPYNLCLEPRAEKFNLLHTFSCQARQYKMAIALGFGDKEPCDRSTDPRCPTDGHYLFNSIALFDQMGDLVAKYNKMHLYYEFHYDLPQHCYPNSDPVVYYDSPHFGRLGFVICYDLLFYQPTVDLVERHRVNTILFSTYWFNYLPFVSGVQMSQAFAIAHRVNFLAANVQIGSAGVVGAGIYSANNGALVYNHLVDGQSKLLIATIPKDPRKTNAAKNCPAMAKKIPISSSTVLNNRPKYLHLDTSLVRLVRLKLWQDYQHYCCPLSGLCCSVYYRAQSETQFSNEYFALVIGNTTSGGLGQSRYPMRQEFCGLVACNDENCHQYATQGQTLFSSIELRAKFASKHVYPAVMTTDGALLPTNQWRFKRQLITETNTDDKQKNSFELSVHNAPFPLIAVTLYGRVYDLDPVYSH